MNEIIYFNRVGDFLNFVFNQFNSSIVSEGCEMFSDDDIEIADSFNVAFKEWDTGKVIGFESMDNAVIYYTSIENVMWVTDEKVIDGEFIENAKSNEIYIYFNRKSDKYRIVTQEDGYILCSVILSDLDEGVYYIESYKSENHYMFLGERLMNA
jgi:hypothetical protein